MNEIDNFLNKQIEASKSPSVQYIIFDKERIIHKFQSGDADVINKKKVDEDTTFCAFSVTKTFTALAILQLQENGKLSIDETLKHYLPNFPYSENITIQQLLTHSAGIPNPIPLNWIHLINEHQDFNTDEFFEQIFAKNRKIKSKPNQKFSYSNLDYLVLGQLIEKVTGSNYEDYITDNILKIIGISSNELSFGINPTLQAKGYQKRMSLINLFLGLFIDKSKYMGKSEGKWKPFKYTYVNGPSYGGLIGTPVGFMKYLQELLKSDCRVISNLSKEILFDENYTNSKKATGMCLSWFKGKLDDHIFYTHAGGGGGYYCEIRIYPELGIGSVIMFNRSGMRDERFLDKLDKYVIIKHY